MMVNGGLRRGARRPLAFSALLRGAGADPLYRSSLILMVNTGVLSVSGFVYWTVAARLYEPSEIGNLAAAIAGAGLLSAFATLGLPQVLLQHVNASLGRRELVMAAVLAITALGGGMTVLVIVFIGPLLPARLHVAESGLQIPLIVAFVVFSSVSTATDAGLIALRKTKAVVLTNLVAAVFRIALLWPLGGLGYHGLMAAYVGGAAMQAIGSLLVVWRTVGRSTPPRRTPASLLREHMRFSSVTYVGTVFGILPSTVVPIFVVADLGATKGAWLTVAFLFAGTVSFIPANTAQALYAEIRIGQVDPRRLALKALRGTYALVTPYVAVLVVGASLLLEIFGGGYSLHAGDALRLIALGGLFTGGTYIVDTIVIALGYTGWYFVTNFANAALVVGGVVIGASHGVTGAAFGWSAGQGISLVIGVLVVLALRRFRQTIDQRGYVSPVDAAELSPLTPPP